MENLWSGLDMRKRTPKIFFTRELNGVITKLYDGDELIGEIVFLTQPLNNMHFMITYREIHTLFANDYELAKETLVTRHFIGRIDDL